MILGLQYEITGGPRRGYTLDIEDKANVEGVFYAVKQIFEKFGFEATYTDDTEDNINHQSMTLHVKKIFKKRKKVQAIAQPKQ